MSENQPENPYLVTTKTVVQTTYAYRADYGDDRICKCGHAYYRHFDTYEQMSPVGCKYCACHLFVEAIPGEPYVEPSDGYFHPDADPF